LVNVLLGISIRRHWQSGPGAVRRFGNEYRAPFAGNAGSFAGNVPNLRASKISGAVILSQGHVILLPIVRDNLPGEAFLLHRRVKLLVVAMLSVMKFNPNCELRHCESFSFVPNI
jgi:hypothetical protein